MLEPSRSPWRKLDNAALAFPAATGRKDTRVFRFYCQLKEQIDREILQESLDLTMKHYPLFQAVLRKGMFWFYLEHRKIRAVVKEEAERPCSRIYVPDQKSLLFEVSYFKNRINFEVFHALTDGTGAVQFLRELVKNYLYLSHSRELLSNVSLTDEFITAADHEEDSFSQYYTGEKPRVRRKSIKAYQLAGPKVEQRDMQIMEVCLSVKELQKKARSYGTTMTVYLSTVLLFSIYKEMRSWQRHKPVTLMIPINLRNYFPSHSMTNFFGWMEIGYSFKKETSFEEVLLSVKEQFQNQLDPEKISRRLNNFVRLEKNPFLRIVPLEVKNLFLQVGTNIGGKSITAIFSNMSVIHMPEEYENYIEHFGFFTSTDKLQLCACSFQDEMMLGITSKLVSTNIQRNFLKLLKEQGIESRIIREGFPEKEAPQPAAGKRFLQWFTFSCLVIAVICGMLNGILTPQVHWSLFVLGGTFCTWSVVMIAYFKRRNLLKNGMWQLLIVTGVCMIWDLATGWKGWSVNYVLPLLSLVVLLSMAVLAKLRKLVLAEYLFYLVMASTYGMIPMLLLLTGVSFVRYPSVICSGISFLFLAALIIFRHKELSQELHKKFHI